MSGHTVVGNPLSSIRPPPAGAPRPDARAAAPPSLAELSPHLHGLLVLVVGPYDTPAPPGILTSRVAFWGAVCTAGFCAFGPGIGPCGGGWVVNLVVGGLFIIGFVWFVLVRRNLRTVLTDLAPVVRSIVDLKHNAAARLERDRARLRCIVLGLAFTFPAVVAALYIFFQTTLRAKINTTAADCGGDRELIGITISFIAFFPCVLIMAGQLALLFAVAQLYTFRLRFLFSVMLQNDRALVAAELSAATPAADRRLLAAAPTDEASPLAEGSAAYIHRPFAAAACAEGGAHDGALTAGDVDKFLRVYRAVREEAARHAKSWSVPLVIFIVVYFFIFCLTVVAIIRDMVRNGSKGQSLSIEIIYVFLTLAYIVFNLVPIISINSTWPRLLDKPEASLGRWEPQERLVLDAYFTKYPLVFPVLGLAFNWNKVYVLVGTALAPLLVNTAVSAVFSAPAGGGGGNSTSV